MKRPLAALLCTFALGVTAAVVLTPTAAAATPSWLRVRTASKATAYNGTKVTVRPAATARGARVITARKITAYRGRTRVASGTSVRLPVGSYKTVTSGTYKAYRYVARTRTKQVLHSGDYASATCLVTSAEDLGLGDGSTHSIATCSRAYYPTQHPSDEQYESYQVGDTYTQSVFFDDEYVTTKYTVKVRKYGANHRFTSSKRSLLIRNGGYRRLFTGHGNRQTASFRPPHNTWKLAYSFRCSDYSNFAIWVYRTNGDLIDLAANDLGTSGHNNSFIHEGGRFYLEIDATDSSCNWTITVR